MVKFAADTILKIVKNSRPMVALIKPRISSEKVKKCCRQSSINAVLTKLDKR